MHGADHTPPTEVRLAVDGDGADDELRSLYDWLGHEDELRGRLELRPRPLAEGEMGGVLDVLAVTLGAGGIGGLISSVSTWPGLRRSDVTVTVTAADGRDVTIDVRGAADPLAVIREAERLTAPPRE
ncbi:hypothetical protein [Streptomyces sp. NPDC097640]|uniref:effector-associated constant component EACC1 n=1 Tax=Streptomyces sp. NPDC097640 TaxID=3157229 RepID=UPI00331CDD4F